MSRPRREPLSRRAHAQGFVLIAILVLLTLGGLYFFVSNLTPEAIELRQKEKTEAALVQAKEALLGYALKYRDEEAAQGNPNRMYGYLPLPDLGTTRNTNISCTTEGCDANTPAGIACDGNNIYPTMIGRLPWRTLGTGPLRDGHGECLWLIVSSLHLRKQCLNPVLPPMNWDTLGQLDIVTANGTPALNSALAVHDRPVAILFAPGPPLPGQNRGTLGGDDVRECGGNYDAANYLDPAVAVALGGVTNYLSGINNASGTTGDSNPLNDPDNAQTKHMLTQGKVFTSAANFLPGSCSGSNCSLVANDVGLPVTSDMLFGTLRNSSYFRTDINSLLDRMVSCLRDEIIVAGGSLSPSYGKIAGADSNGCYGTGTNPQGYYPHYKEMIFVAAPGSVSVALDGGSAQSCAGALLFAGQRDTVNRRCPVGSPTGVQQRSSAAERSDNCNYLEGANLSSFSGSGNSFSGNSQLARVSSAQTAFQDIVRCIPASASFNQVSSPILASLGLSQLTAYDPATRTLTLGAVNVTTSQVGTANAKALFGCSWTPELHGMGSGLRSYFKFNISNTGEGFTFAIIDGDRNGSTVCGAAQQHLGYSGNNTSTPPIAYPKIGIEVDTTQTAVQQGAFNPAASSTLANGRSDPNYIGGHVAIVYWGGESPVATGNTLAGCTAPRYWSSGACYLPQEEDDNVHGLPTPPGSSSRPAPRNPPAPATPAVAPAGVYKLDPSLSSIPSNKDIHVRVEVSKMSLYSLTPVRIATQTPINLSTPGALLDGVAMSNGDRVLVTAQSTSSANGIYVWNGATSAMTRATDANTATALLEATTQVTQGTQAGTSWRQTQWITTLGTDSINWTTYSNRNVARYLVESWILADSVTVANQIAAMQNTTRSMNQLHPTFVPHLRGSPLVFDIQGGACPCGTGQICGSDNLCYTNVFRNVRLGFTNSQSTTARDQVINITNFATTWLP